MGIKDDSKRLEELISMSNTWFWTTFTLLLDADTHDALLDLLQPLVVVDKVHISVESRDSWYFVHISCVCMYFFLRDMG